MTLVSGKKELIKAMKNGYAIGHFNVCDLETVQAVVTAASEERSPVIVAATETAIEYSGLNYLVSLVKNAASKTKIPIILHLDHGKNLKIIKECINAGFTSVMIDASHLPFKENVAMTKKVVQLAKLKNTAVEAEIGSLTSPDIAKDDSPYTNPKEAAEFVKLTGIDSLAVAIGTSHGAYKFKGKSNLDFKRLKEIDDVVNIPLVLHGASEIPQYIIKKGIKFGAKWHGARGLDEDTLRTACRQGINKVNVHTDLDLIYISAIREFLTTNPEVMDPRQLLGYAREQLKEFIMNKLDILGSNGKA